MKNGFLLIDKNENISSNELDYKAKKIYNTKKIGHLGTLDPFASGLMILAINSATKLLPYVDEEKKTYLATIVFNEEKDTLDITGKTLSKSNVVIKKEELIIVLNSFLGKSKQTPPKYSAVHINGRRAYDLARENIEFTIKEKDIYIYDIKLLELNNNIAKIKTTVSKGTYIRQLAFDIAKKLSTVAFLSTLRRIEIGNFNVDSAKKITNLTQDDLISIDNFFPNIKKIEINDELLLKLVKNGNILTFKIKEEKLFFTYKKEIIALYKKQDDNKYHLACLFNN